MFAELWEQRSCGAIRRHRQKKVKQPGSESEKPFVLARKGF